MSQKKAFLRWAIVATGVLVTLYGGRVIVHHGFYLSLRGDPGQLEGGLGPFFLVLGLACIVYGFLDMYLHK